MLMFALCNCTQLHGDAINHSQVLADLLVRALCEGTWIYMTLYCSEEA